MTHSDGSLKKSLELDTAVAESTLVQGKVKASRLYEKALSYCLRRFTFFSLHKVYKLEEPGWSSVEALPPATEPIPKMSLQSEVLADLFAIGWARGPERRPAGLPPPVPEVAKEAPKRGWVNWLLGV